MATELGKAYVQIMPSAKGIQGSITKQLAPEASSAGTSAGSLIGSKLVGVLGGVIAAAKIGQMITDGIKASLMREPHYNNQLVVLRHYSKTALIRLKNTLMKHIKQQVYLQMLIWKT